MSLHTPMPASALPVGTFQFTDPAQRWWWSDTLYEIHGMRPGDVVPTIALAARHVHPDDRPRVVALLHDAVAHPEPFGCQYRLLRLDAEERVVTLTGAFDPSTGSVRGTVADVTVPQREVVAHEVNDQLAKALRSHAVIDQAKGVFMLAYGVDGEVAFELLRWSSQQRNVRVSALAERVVAAVTGTGGLGPVLRRRLDHFFVTSFDDEVLVPRRAPETVQIVSTAFDGRPGLAVSGPVDLATASELAGALAGLIKRAQEGSAVTVDLRDVSYLSPAGASTLRSARRHAAARGVQLRVVPGRGDARLPLDDAEGLVEFADRAAWPDGAGRAAAGARTRHGAAPTPAEVHAAASPRRVSSTRRLVPGAEDRSGGLS